jgi:hypothetical protein
MELRWWWWGEEWWTGEGEYCKWEGGGILSSMTAKKQPRITQTRLQDLVEGQRNRGPRKSESQSN